MTDQPTPEPTAAQRFQAAHRALEDALAELCRAHQSAAQEAGADALPPGILVDFVVVTATHHDLGGGQSATDHSLFGPVEGAAYRAVGLLETGRDRLRASLVGGAGEG